MANSGGLTGRRLDNGHLEPGVGEGHGGPMPAGQQSTPAGWSAFIYLHPAFQPYGTQYTSFWNQAPIYQAGCHPHVQVSALLGVHLHPSTRKKIWRGEFMDLFSLLFREPEPKPWTGCGALNRELEQYKCPKVEKNWDNWLSSYTILMAVVLQT